MGFLVLARKFNTYLGTLHVYWNTGQMQHARDLAGGFGSGGGTGIPAVINVIGLVIRYHPRG